MDLFRWGNRGRRVQPENREWLWTPIRVRLLSRAQRTAWTPCGWHGTVTEFLALDQPALLESLSARHQRVMGMRPDGLQMAAWRGEYEILGATRGEIVAFVPRAREWAVIFEYELPRERGRRPDVVILIGCRLSSSR